MSQVTLIKLDNENSIVTALTSVSEVLVKPAESVFNTLGIQGLAGTNGTDADKHYAHAQGVAASVWNINHNLNKFPSVTVIDSGNNIVEGETNYTDLNNVILTFSGAFSGKAYFN